MCDFSDKEQELMGGGLQAMYRLIRKMIPDDFWEEVLSDPVMEDWKYLNNPIVIEALLNSESSHPPDYYYFLYELTLMLFEYAESCEAWIENDEAAIKELEEKIEKLKTLAGSSESLH